MKTTFNAALAPIVLILSLHAPRAEAGRPLPYEYPAVFRQANLVMLKFQEALVAEHWDEALAFCSERVRQAAAASASSREFLSKSLPLPEVLASHRFGYWKEQHNGDQHLYGMFLELAPGGQEPRVQWFWSMSTTDKGWLIDWEPVVLDRDALMEKKKAELADRERRVEAARRELEPKLRSIKTHLTAVSERFVLGEPMLFRVEFMNFGDAPVRFTAAGVGYDPLVVRNAEGERIPCLKGPAQLMQTRGELAPGAATVLAGEIDLNRDYAFAAAGTYDVQFDGKSLAVGEWIDSGQPVDLPDRQFVSTPTTFPSNVLRIEIAAGAEVK
jgi:hypothetical protein